MIVKITSFNSERMNNSYIPSLFPLGYFSLWLCRWCFSCLEQLLLHHSFFFFLLPPFPSSPSSSFSAKSYSFICLNAWNKKHFQISLLRESPLVKKSLLRDSKKAPVFISSWFAVHSITCLTSFTRQVTIKFTILIF